jgi:hypothetical protein
MKIALFCSMAHDGYLRTMIIFVSFNKALK